MKEIDISLCINDHTFEGKALYDDETDRVNLSNITADYACPEAHLSDCATYEGYVIGAVADLLSYEVKRKVYPEADDEGHDYVKCGITGYYFPRDLVVYSDELGQYIRETISCYSPTMDDYLYVHDALNVNVRTEDGDIRDDYVSQNWVDSHYYCDHCSCYLENSDDYVGNDTCRWCEEEEEPDIIEGYSDSHRHNQHPVYFGGSDDEHNLNSFAGMGFELEVDSKDEDFGSGYNNETAGNLCSEAGLESDEMRFAHDGSLNYGFECISQPHTVEDFWAKTDKWEKMLKYLLSRGYRSHDPGTCGLHVHVSRNMFGKTQAVQDSAIAKVYAFYDDNWDDLVKVSRRRSFDYCDRNVLSASQQIYAKKTGKYKQWKARSKASASKGHYVALNNNGEYTFEYRLARGTLNAWSFFSWIDLTLTITRNARRITVKQVETNDKVSWLSGITESTARYLYKRNAFKDTVLALYPSIAWSQDTRDTDEE